MWDKKIQFTDLQPFQVTPFPISSAILSVSGVVIDVLSKMRARRNFLSVSSVLEDGAMLEVKSFD